MYRYLFAAFIALAALAEAGIPVDAAPDFGNAAFAAVWARSDQSVATSQVSRSWLWGPQPDSAPLYERYLDAPNGERLIQYFDKGRMEINDPSGDPSSPWYVTSGLLDRELIGGRIQIGTSVFLDTSSGATVPVAGDPDNVFPTYNDLRQVIDTGQPDRTGGYATAALLGSGPTTRGEAASDPDAQFVHYVGYTGPNGSPVGYNLPRAFWNFMTQSGATADGGNVRTADPLFDWLFVLGYPIADPFWSQVILNGQSTWVLIQPFERRLLTYTPSNPAGWQVEMGNIGQHYQRWRYAHTPQAALNGNIDYYGMQTGNQWRFSTTTGGDQTWVITGTSRSFVAGATLIRRLETGETGQRATYWSVTPAGLDLYGADALDAVGNVTDSTMYWPPIHFFNDSNPYIGQSWSTPTMALSMSGPAKPMTISMQVSAWQTVSTPAGLIDAWKLNVVQWTTADKTHPAQVVTTFWVAPKLGTIQWLTDGFAAQLKSATALPAK